MASSSSLSTSTLTLIIEKGPRGGETLEFSSKSTVRIGRVVRGNNLPIKEQGISSKHLTIDFSHDLGKWVVVDLDSSNGTILNDNQVEPFLPSVVSDGDVIKIGEMTSIMVRVGIGEGIDGVNARRNTGRRNNLEEEVRVRVLEGGDLGGNQVDGENFRDEVRRRNLGVGSEGGVNLGEDIRVRVSEENDGENRKVGTLEVNHKDGEEVKVGISEGVNDRKNESGLGVNDGVDLNEGEKKKGRGRGRGRPKKGVVIVEERKGESNVNEESVIGKGKGESGVSTRRTRSSRRGAKELVSLDEVMPRKSRRGKNVSEVALREVKEESELDVGVVVEKKTRGARGRKKKVDVEVELEGVEEVGLRDDETRMDLSGMGNGEMVELRVQLCEGEMDDDNLKNIVEETVSSDVLNVGVNESKGKKGGQVGVKEGTNVVEDVGLEDEPGRNSSGMESSEMIELREQSCDVQMDDTNLKNVVEETVNSDVSDVAFRENDGGSLCDGEDHYTEPIEDTYQKNEPNNKTDSELQGMEVPELVEGSIYASEQACVDPIDDTAEHDKSEDGMNGDVLEEELEAYAGGALSFNQQPCSESKNKSYPQNEPKENVNSEVQMEVPAFLNKCLVDVSQAEKRYSDVLESDFATEDEVIRATDTMEDEVTRANDTRDIPEQSNTSFSGRETSRESLQAPDLEKMTLGEWFDYLEVYLPKQIYNATDEIIDDMRKRAKQFDEFMLEQQKEKGNLPQTT